jgi:hypothetical protein
MNDFIFLAQFAIVLFVSITPLVVLIRLGAGSETVRELSLQSPAEPGWPRGVQEEDPRPWNFGPAAVGVGSPADAAPSRVEAKRSVAPIPA